MFPTQDDVSNSFCAKIPDKNGLATREEKNHLCWCQTFDWICENGLSWILIVRKCLNGLRCLIGDILSPYNSRPCMLLKASCTISQFSCNTSNIEGVSSIMSMAFFVAVASKGGNAAEKQYPINLKGMII